MEYSKSKYVYRMPPPAAEPAQPEVSQQPTETAAPDDQPFELRLSPPAVSRLKPLAPAREPALPPRGFDGTRSQVSRRMVVLVSAAAGLLLLGTYMAYRNARAAKPVIQQEIVEHLDFSELSALPEPLQAGAQAILAGKFQFPAWRQSMEPGSGGAELSFPIQEAVEELHPTLRWSFEAPSANVAVISPTHQVVARTELFKHSQWTVPEELQRGTIYTWEVVTLGQVQRNSFRVIDDTEAGWLMGLRLAQHDQSHLLMGIAYLELGMLSKAQSEFQALLQQHPHSPEAAHLLQTANSFVRR